MISNLSILGQCIFMLGGTIAMMVLLIGIAEAFTREPDPGEYEWSWNDPDDYTGAERE